MCPSQAERAPGVDRVVGVVPHARRGAAPRYRRERLVSPELVRVQRDYCARALGFGGGQSLTQFAGGNSLYRREKTPWLAESSGHLVTPSLHAEANDMNPVLSIRTLSVLSHHVVGGSILLPGVGYVEVAFAAGASRRAVLSAVAFVRPCVLPAPGWGAASERCTLRCMRREADTFEIASLSSTGPLPHWFGCLGLADSCKDSSSEMCLSRRTYLARPGEHTEASVQCNVDRAALLSRVSPSAVKISIEQTLVGSSGHWLRRRVAPLPDTETIDLF